MSFLTFSHFAIIMMSIGSLIVWAYWAKANHKIAYFVALCAWLINVLAFSIVRYFNLPVMTTYINSWSLAIRLQAVVTLFGVGLYMAMKHKSGDNIRM